MKRLFALGMVLAGCARSPSACPSPADAAPERSTVQLAPLASRPAVAIDVAASEPGRVVVASVVDEKGRGRVVTSTWDVSAMRAVPGVERTVLVRDEDGDPASVAVAALGGVTYSAIDTEAPQHVVVTSSDGAYAALGSGTLASIVAGEGRVVVAYTQTAYGHEGALRVASLEPRTLREVTSIELPGADTFGGLDIRRTQRPRALALAGARVYVVVPREPRRVVALELPSLRAVASRALPERTSRDASRNAPIAQRDGRVFVLDGGVVLELTSDLLPVREAALAADELDVGPDRALLSATGVGSTGYRWDVVPALGKRASCTPAWIAATPLLACAIDLAPPVLVRLR